MRLVIIPPTFYKEMTNPFIQEIFLKAYKILREADRLFICGYSFPDADIHIKYLLKRAERFRGGTPEIYIINNHPNKTRQQKSEEKQRFMRFFKEKRKVYYESIIQRICQKRYIDVLGHYQCKFMSFFAELHSIEC